MFILYQTLLLFSILLFLEASHIFCLHLEYKSYSKQEGFFPPNFCAGLKESYNLFISAVMQDIDIYQPTETPVLAFFLWKGLVPKGAETATKALIPHVWEGNSVMKRKNKKFIFLLCHYFRQYYYFFSGNGEVL